MAEDRIVPFVFEGEQALRVLMRGDEPWFVATDVCRIIGVSNVTTTVKVLDEDERGLCFSKTPGGSQEMNIISESGLYTLMFRSRDAVTPGSAAHRFRRWVTGEVLPQIRRTGRYDLANEAAQIRQEAAQMRQVGMVLKIFGIEAARRLWLQLKLPRVPEMEGAVPDAQVAGEAS